MSTFRQRSSKCRTLSRHKIYILYIPIYFNIWGNITVKQAHDKIRSAVNQDVLLVKLKKGEKVVAAANRGLR